MNKEDLIEMAEVVDKIIMREREMILTILKEAHYTLFNNRYNIFPEPSHVPKDEKEKIDRFNRDIEQRFDELHLIYSSVARISVVKAKEILNKDSEEKWKREEF